jgi:hypothetical protein
MPIIINIWQESFILKWSSINCLFFASESLGSYNMSKLNWLQENVWFCISLLINKLIILILKRVARSIDGKYKLLNIDKIILIFSDYNVCSYLKSSRYQLFLIVKKSYLPIWAPTEKTTMSTNLWLIQQSIRILNFISNILNLVFFSFTLIVINFECL